MRLARVKGPSGDVVLAAQYAPGRLVLLDGVGVDDPVVALDRLGLAALRQLVHERSADPALTVSEDSVTFDVPVGRPQKIICVALNYAEHAAEGDQQAPDEPVIFFKPPSSLLPHGGTVCNPARSRRLDYEVELGVVIGVRATNVQPSDWGEVVCGYTVFNDVTARDMQLVSIDRNQPWDHSKAFDTFAPCGPYLVTTDEIPDPMDLSITLQVGQQVRQASRTSYMIFDIPTLLQAVSRNITLEPGDIIATGTPSGIGPVNDGEVMIAEIEGVGRLVNAVVYERRPTAAAAAR